MTDKTNWAVGSGATRGVTVNGAPFFGRGVCYSPVPWGGSPNWEPYGDFMFSTWSGIWQRDIPLMRAAGINLIRVYNMLDVIAGVPRDHSGFFDACWNGGVDPIYIQIGFGDLSNLKTYLPWDGTAGVRDAVEKAFLAMVAAFGSQPAVMAFNLGNEVNNLDTPAQPAVPDKPGQPGHPAIPAVPGTINNPKFWQWMDALAVRTKQVAPGKLTMMSLVDDSMQTVQKGNRYVPNLDLWGINSYRGKMTSPQTNNFDILWKSFAAASEKPLLVSEWGAPASTHDANGNLVFTGPVVDDLCTYATGHHADICFNAATTTSNGGAANLNAQNWAPVCIGATYFEWTDEWWKLDDAYPGSRCPATVQNPGRSRNDAFPGGWGDEECYGLNAIQPVGPPDPLTRPGPPKPGNAPPGWVSCPGAWNFAANTPYPPDKLTPRKTLATLTKLWKA